MVHIVSMYRAQMFGGSGKDYCYVFARSVCAQQGLLHGASPLTCASPRGTTGS